MASYHQSTEQMPRKGNLPRNPLALACLLAVSSSRTTTAEVTTNAPNTGFGNCRNLFAEAGHAPSEVRQKIDAAFRKYGNPFTLDGRQLSVDHSPGLTAMNAVAALAATQPLAKNISRNFGLRRFLPENTVTTTVFCICSDCCIAAVNSAFGRRTNRCLINPDL